MRWAVGLLLLSTLGCMKHRIDVRTPDVIIPKEAILGDITLKGCKGWKQSPPVDCKKAIIPYQKHTEQIRLQNSK